jgi:5-methylcytosine-specific restriction endonuclease McrA
MGDVRNTRRWRYIVKPRILARDHFTCWRCGGRATEVDHIIPHALGGPTTPDNLRAACRRCNRSSGGRLGAERAGWGRPRHVWPGALD